MAVLELTHVSKRFGTREIIRDVTLSVEAGGIFGFLGPNGAGKTTSIRLVAGILRPTAGGIRIAGHDLAAESLAAKRLTGYIPDAPWLYPRLTAWEYLELVADLYGLDAWEARGRELLARFDLADRGDHFIASYSYGMRQKLSIAAGVLHGPALIVVDEPLIGLDPPAARSVKELLRSEAARGAAVFMSTHLLEIAESLCDSVGILDRGELIAVGPLAELLERKQARLEEVFLRLLAERREEGSEERRKWEALADAARSERRP